MKTPKNKPSQIELQNDPSLQWCPYRKFESVWSDVHGTRVRFVEYVGDKIRVASLHGISVLPDLADVTQVRR